MILKKRITTALKKCQILHTLKSRKIVENSESRFLIKEGEKYYNFSSNDYLGLSRHPSIINAWKKGADLYGVGSGGSIHVSGYTKAHYQFEEAISSWLGYPRALLFISGFSANQAVIHSLMKKGDFIFADRLSHASLLEAANLSQAKLRRFLHNDIQSLLSLYKISCTGQLLVITEGIFSMDGDEAPLSAIHDITKKMHGWLMVDDAHGFGVIGASGKGSCENKRVKPEILVVTFGKGAGISGAAVLCDEDVAEYLLQYAKHLIYSTSMPPAQAMALLASLNVIRSEEGEEKRKKLAQNIQLFRKEATSLPLYLSESCCAIQPLIIGDNIRTLALVRYLRKKGIWVVAIRPPTVPKDTSRIRITLSSFHEESDIFVLLEALYVAGK